MDLGKLQTESRNIQTMNMDAMSIPELLEVMNAEDRKCAEAVHETLPQIAKAVELCIASLKAGGRMIYIGAGTSGRLGILDASECVPTFSSEQVVGVIAGGKEAVFRGIEGAEDSEEGGKQDLKAIGLNAHDTVIGIAASGRTPYVIGALKYAEEVHANRVSVACNNNAVISQYAEAAIEADAGSEVLTGSTRLKAGTCTKMICNMLSTASMTGIGKVYKNLMVDMQPTNQKLEDRAVRIIAEAAECGREQAAEAYEASGHSMKTAIIMILNSCTKQEAEESLKQAGGFVRKASELR